MDVLSLLLDYNADVNIPKQDGTTALLVAADQGYEDIVGLLLAFSADVNNADNVFALSPLFLAAANGHAATADLLLSHGAIIDFYDRARSSVLHQACANHHTACVRVLFKYHVALEAVDCFRRTALHTACARNAAGTDVADTISLLLEHGIDPNARDCRGDTSLHIAARLPNTALFELLLQHDASLEALNEASLTPLQTLMRRMHQLDKSFDEESLLHFAVRNGLLTLFARLVEVPAIDINVRTRKKQESLLHLTASHPDPEMSLAFLQLLLEQVGSLFLFTFLYLNIVKWFDV